jgi:hypothetical protein
MNYQQEIIERLSKILLTVLDLLISKKFLAAIGAGLTGWYQTGDARILVGSLVAYVLAQGVADHGKESAFVNMAVAAMKQGPGSRAEGLAFSNPIPQTLTPTTKSLEGITGKPVGTLFPVYITEVLVKAGLLTIESILTATDDDLAAAGLTDSQIFKVRETINLQR